MNIQFFHPRIVDEHHLGLFIQIDNEPYVLFISHMENKVTLLDMVHQKEGECQFCHEFVLPYTPCFHFLLHSKDIAKLEKMTEKFLKITYIKSPFIFNRKKSDQAHRFIDQIKKLKILSNEREEEIESYGEHFDFYRTIINQKSYTVSLKGKKKELKEESAFFFPAKSIQVYIEKEIENPLSTLRKMEQEITKRYDVEKTKRTKITQIIQSIKGSILLYNQVYQWIQSEAIQDLIVYLNEILYREIPIEAADDTEFLQKHDQISSTIYLYVADMMSYDECLRTLIKNPHQESETRKDRVIFATQALQKAEEVYQIIKEKEKEIAHLWIADMKSLLYTYLHIELGMFFLLSRDKQKKAEEGLKKMLENIFQGNVKEIQRYHLLDSEFPFIQQSTYEKINQLLQKASKKEAGYVFYLMEIELKENFSESLTSHEAYKEREKLEVAEYSLVKDSKEYLSDWLTKEEKIILIELFKQFGLEGTTSRMWKVKDDELNFVDEYILYNGERLYRLHFRKKA